MTFLKHFDQKHGSATGYSPPISYSACWGYVAPNGREYAISGTYTGTAIIDITDTGAVAEITHITGPSSIWREMRTYKQRAYVVTEGGGGVQIIDLRNLPASASLIRSFNHVNGSKNTLRSHSIEIFNGYMYLNGCANWSPGGVLIFSLANPDTPQYVGQYQPQYIHDSYVRHDTLFGASIYSGGGLNIANVANKAAPVHIAKISYTGSVTHNAWTTTDGRYVITTDEVTNGSTSRTLKFWDLQSLPTPPTSPVVTYAINPVDLEHNVFVRGNYAYVAWYAAGIVVVDITNPTSPATAGWYDTSTLTGSEDGVWSVYPYYWSGKIIAGDMQNGLYIFKFDSLAPRQPVSLIEPADAGTIYGNSPIEFRWTRVADPLRDPHTYSMVLDGAGFDTTISLGSDTSFAFSNSSSLCAGTYAWYIITRDEINDIATIDTFSFTREKALVLSSPDGNEILKSGTNASINWSVSACIDSLELSYSTDNGISWNLIVPSVPASLQTYLWNVPNAPTSQGMVRLREVADTTFIDESTASFTIMVSPYIQLLSPNGGEFWGVGSVHTVTWTSQVVGDIMIEYSTDDGISWSTITASIPAVAGSYEWTIPSEGANNAIVRISDASNSSLLDMSDAPFVLSIGQLNLSASWNLISMPAIPSNPLFLANFPGASSSAFAYNGTYVSRDSIQEGIGYWLKYNTQASLEVIGTLLERDTISVTKRWNLIGSISNPVAVSSVVALPNTITVSGFYAYRSDSGYYQPDSIFPGKGYWVRASEAGELILDPSLSATHVIGKLNRDFTGMNTLQFEDAKKHSATLHFGETFGNQDRNLFELPPAPPQGIFDIRFASQRFVEEISSFTERIDIQLHSVVFPLTVTLIGGDNALRKYRLIETNVNGSETTHDLSASRNIVLRSVSSGVLQLQVEPSDYLPEGFVLYDNFPNPFNPSTVIRYQLPAMSYVQLNVYNVLGEQVAALVNELREPGSYEVQWDASGVPSGVYYCRLFANGLNATKKLVLMK